MLIWVERIWWFICSWVKYLFYYRPKILIGDLQIATSLWLFNNRRCFVRALIFAKAPNSEDLFVWRFMSPKSYALVVPWLYRINGAGREEVPYLDDGVHYDTFS